MSAPTLILISGYARAGKGTLANGILEWSKRPAAHVNFADALKDAANVFLADLGLPGDFHDEAFKVAHRDFLVAAGRFGRSLNRNVFAENLARWVTLCCDGADRPVETVVCSDWRYLNELHVCRDYLYTKGWRIRTIYVETVGVLPANDEEAWSVREIDGHAPYDAVYLFRPYSVNEIKEEGRRLAASWNL